MRHLTLLALYMKPPALNYRIVALSIIAAIAMFIALLVLAPSLAQGASRDFAEGTVMSSTNTPGQSKVSWDVPPTSRQSDSRQVSPGGPATMSECKEELAAGRAVRCTRNSFAVKTLLPGGGYHINWSEWAGQQDNVDRYTVQRLRFMYRFNFERESDGVSVEDSDYTRPDVNSCWPWAVESNGDGEVTRWAWSCNGISNVRVDPTGAPTSAEQLEGYEDNFASTSWSGSLQAPGRKHDVSVQALRIPGDREAPHADNPQSWSDRLTRQQVDDGTHDLLASEFEMHLYLITVHFEDGSTQHSYNLVDGSSFDDR